MSYSIKDTSYEGKYGPVTRFELEVDGVHMATLTQAGRKDPELTWAVHGPQSWPAAKQLLLGLLELSVHADKLSKGAFNARVKS